MQEDFEQFLSTLDEHNYFMLEEEIDIETQNKYFTYSRKVDKKQDKAEIFSRIPELTDADTDIDSKKDVLVKLATLRDVEAFRVLEKAQRNFDNEELNIWSILAYNESKMLISGSIKNEQQVFISTGLGGKNGKFRYFVVLLPHEDLEAFSEFQRDFVKKELEFTLQRHNSEVEVVLEEKGAFISFKLLIPIKAHIPKLFKEIQENCNQLAPFVSERFLITNVNEMDEDEIFEFIDSIDDDDETEIEDIITLN